MSAEPPTAVTVVTYQFEVDDDEWQQWKRTVPRDKSLDTRIRELLKADREGRVLDAVHDGDSPTREYHDVVDDVARDSSVVDEITDGWTDSDERLAQRRSAAEAAVELARERGQLGRSIAVDELLPQHSVPGQNEETWWRQNIRPVLSEIGTFSPSDAAYILEPER